MQEPGMSQPGSAVSPDQNGDTDDSFNLIQKITGKLTQRMRDSQQTLSDKNYKYIINSVLSAVDPAKLTDGDKQSIIAKLNGGQQSTDELTEEDEMTVDNTREEPGKYNTFINTDFIKKVLDKSGIDTRHEDIDLLVVDIVEAIYVYINDYSDNKTLNEYLKNLLDNNGLKPRTTLLSYNNLDPDGKDIYLTLVSIGEETDSTLTESKNNYKKMLTNIFKITNKNGK